MSLWESGESSGSVSLAKLFEGGDFPVAPSNGMTLADVAFAVCRGGWPKSIGLSRRAALQQSYNYVDALVERDISRVDGKLRDPVRARRLLRSYARLQGTQATASVLRADLAANADGDNIGVKADGSPADPEKVVFIPAEGTQNGLSFQNYTNTFANITFRNVVLSTQSDRPIAFRNCVFTAAAWNPTLNMAARPTTSRPLTPGRLRQRTSSTA